MRRWGRFAAWPAVAALGLGLGAGVDRRWAAGVVGWVPASGGQVVPLASLARQGAQDDCGPAVLAFVLLALGRVTRPAAVWREAGGAPTPWSLAQLARAGERLGLRVRLVELDALVWPGWHVLHLATPAGGHFVAARRLGGEALQVFDPASGVLTVTDADRLRGLWTGGALWVEGERVPRSG